MDCIPQVLFVNGKVAERDLVAEHRSTRSGDPWVEHDSLALMVHPMDVEKFQKDANKRGLNVKFRKKDGMPEFRSRAAQRDYCKAYGFTNYGDTW